MVEAAEQDGRLRPGRDDRGADLRQHRRRPRYRGRAARLPLHLRHAGQDEPGEDLDAPRVRRRGRDHAHRGRSALARELLRGLGSACGGDTGWLQARPVLEPGEPRSALRDHRPGDLGADRRGRRRRDRHLGRHGRDDHRRRPLLQGARVEGAHRRRRSRRLGLHRRRGAPRRPVSRRGDRQGVLAGHARRVGRRRVGARLRPRLVPHRAAPGARGRPARRRLDGLDGVGGDPGGEAARPRRARPHDVSRTRAAPTCRSSTTTTG